MRKKKRLLLIKQMKAPRYYNAKIGGNAWAAKTSDEILADIKRALSAITEGRSVGFLFH